MIRLLICALAAASLASPADAQLLRRKADRGALVVPPPLELSPAEAAIWPFPAPPPQSWWDDKRPLPTRAADPLGGRRLGKGDRLPALDNGIEPTAYRLWGLTPLQWQILRGDEMIIEVWVRPSRTVSQNVARVIVRRDGAAYVQGRAGLACCEPGIARRVGFDVELPADAGPRFQALRTLPLWSAPRDVTVADAGGATDALCVDGVAYDVTLVTASQTRTLRRACDNAAIGQLADVLAAVLTAAMGHDARYDVLFPRGTDFNAARAAYAELIASGGGLRSVAAPSSRPPGFEIQPTAGEDDPPMIPSNPAP